ncbi:MAG: class I SAM-dependent methyltransferase, partial [Candidatus Rokubacteria bacterium]|nr:class I SAM-dependent methyltransferase [Candidatus Rokubacteria bacterium]
GLLSRWLTDREWLVTGIERDPVLAKAGEASCERMIVADLDRGVPPLDRIYDVIIYGDVLEHLADPLTTLRRLNRGLVVGGDVVISLPNVAHLWMRLSLLLGHFDYADHGILDRGHLRFFTERSVRRLLDEADLEVVRRTVTAAPLHRVVGLRWHGATLSAIHSVSSRVAQLCPRLLGYQFVVLARPRAHAPC